MSALVARLRAFAAEGRLHVPLGADTAAQLADVLDAAAALDAWLMGRAGQPPEAFALRRALRALDGLDRACATAGPR